MTTFSYVTTCKKKNGLLLIAVSERQFNTQNNGHQDLFLGGLSHMSGFLGIIHIGLLVALKSPETTYRNSLQSILCLGWSFVIM